MWVIDIISRMLSVVVPVLISISYLTVVERKVIGNIQKRRSPNVVGFFGLLQPLADGMKLMFKESLIPSLSNKYLFIYSPIVTMFLSLVAWGVIPFTKGVVFSNINIGIFYLLGVSSLGVYGIIISGWSSNSKYGFLGALRSAAQMVSYEVSLGIIIMNITVFVGSLNLSDFVEYQRDLWFIIPLHFVFMLFFISSVAETNRPPFDLPEAEAELVAGYNVEYSSMGFALFFIGEYGNTLLMAFLIAIMFMGGWYFFGVYSIIFLMIKVCLILFLFIWVRAAMPRYRYDQLMRLGWKVLMPLSIGFLFFCSGFLVRTIGFFNV